MIPNVAMTIRPYGVPADPKSARAVPEPMLSRRRSELAAEARRLTHRRSIAEAVARRSRDNDRGLSGEAPAMISDRAIRRATRLRLVFHRAIESLWEVGGFDEALTLFREHKAEVARRSAQPG